MSQLEQPIYLVAALRTPIGRFGGGLSSLTAPDLAVASAKATIPRSGLGPAETLAEQYGISRQEQDEYAVETQRRAGVAYEEGRFRGEIVPVTVSGRKGDIVIDHDEHPRFDADLASMAKLPPVFRKNGSVHAGNSSGVTDGASSMLVVSGAALETH